MKQKQIPLLKTLLLLLTLFFIVSAYTQTNVIMQHNDLKRTGCNNNETILTQENVSYNFGKLFSRKVDDKVYAQPLIISGLYINGTLHNVLFIATANNSVYAFDADDPLSSEPLWHTNLTSPGYRPVHNYDFPDSCTNFIGNVGIISTPAIDINTKTIYVVTRSVLNGDTTFIQYIHALDITNGTERKFSPVKIEANVESYSQGNINGIVYFDPLKNNQRAGLLLQDNILYICWASQCDVGPYHGWMMGYEASTLQQKYVCNITRRGGLGGGIWMSGQAPAVDDDGFIYITTGNGTVGRSDGSNVNDTTNRSESLLKLKPDSGRIKVFDFFTPSNWNYLNQYDYDYGSDGALLIPNTHLSLSGSKQSYLYLIDDDNMGKTTADDANVLQKLNMNAGNGIYPNHLHGTPVYYKNENGQEYIYAWAEGWHLKQVAFKRSNMRFDTSNEIIGNAILKEGMPGAFLAVSSNNSQKGTGILWASHPLSGNALNDVVPGILQAYDANNIQHELWNSNLAGSRDSIGRFAKFVCPTVANGKVYMATFSGEVAVYGINPLATSSCKFLPLPWRHGDIGAVSKSGDVCVKNDTIHISSWGTTANDKEDACHLLFQSFNNDASGEIKASVLSIDTGKISLTFRNNLDPGSPQVLLSLGADSSVYFSYRKTQEDVFISSPNTIKINLPCWLQLKNNNDRYIAYTSTDNIVWTALDSIEISLGKYPYTGIALAANDSTTANAYLDSIDVRINVPLFSMGPLSAKNINDETAKLSWTAANETAGDIFYIEKSKNNILFYPAGIVNAQTGSGTHNYSFDDNAPSPGNNYYRVKRYSDNGAVAYSDTAALIFNSIVFSVFPNPAQNQLFIKYNEYPQSGSTIQLQLVSMNGALVYDKNEILTGTDLPIIIQLPAFLKNGLYMLRVINAKGDVRMKKIMVQR